MGKLSSLIREEKINQESGNINFLGSFRERVSKEVFSVLKELSPIDCFEMLDSGLPITDIERKTLLSQAERLIFANIKRYSSQALYKLKRSGEFHLSKKCFDMLVVQIQENFLNNFKLFTLEQTLKLYIQVNKNPSQVLCRDSFNEALFSKMFESLGTYNFLETDYKIIIVDILTVTKISLIVDGGLNEKIFNFIKMYTYHALRDLGVDKGIVFCSVFRNLFLSVDKRIVEYIEKQLSILTDKKYKAQQEHSHREGKDYKKNHYNSSSQGHSSNQGHKTGSQQRDPKKEPIGLIELLNILGLKPGATKQDVERAFRKLALKHHPDTGGSHYEMTFLIGVRDKLKEQLRQ